VQELLGQRDVRTTMTYLHVMRKGALGVKSPVLHGNPVRISERRLVAPPAFVRLEV
jgi:hypothetical protein